jgi:hypothetical protein
MKKESIVTIISCAFFILFTYTAVNKLVAYNFYLFDLKRSPILSRFAIPLSVLVPVSELIVAALIFPNKTKRIGFLGALILMATFTIYVAYVLKFTKERPCTCGGIIRTLSWPNHLIFNIAFLILAIFGFILTKKQVQNNYA